MGNVANSEDSTTRPLLLIDIDGALSPLPDYKRFPREPPGHPVPGFDPKIDWMWVTVNCFWFYWAPFHPRVPTWLTELAEVYELAWATTWNDMANANLPGPLGIEPLPWIDFRSERPAFPWATRSYKLPYIAAFVGDRPTAWIDDQHGTDARRWAAARPEPTLLVGTRWRVGITQKHVDRLIAWAGNVSAHDEHAPD